MGQGPASKGTSAFPSARDPVQGCAVQGCPHACWGGGAEATHWDPGVEPGSKTMQMPPGLRGFGMGAWSPPHQVLFLRGLLTAQGEALLGCPSASSRVTVREQPLAQSLEPSARSCSQPTVSHELSGCSARAENTAIPAFPLSRGAPQLSPSRLHVASSKSCSWKRGYQPQPSPGCRC